MKCKDKNDKMPIVTRRGRAFVDGGASTSPQRPRSKTWDDLSKVYVPPEMAPIITCLRDLDERMLACHAAAASPDGAVIAAFADTVAVLVARDRALREYCLASAKDIRAHGLEGPESAEVFEEVVAKMDTLATEMPLLANVEPLSEAAYTVGNALRWGAGRVGG